MKDRVWFNRKLFWDTIRQLRVMGITYLGICVVISAMPPIIMSIEGSPSLISIELFAPVLYLFATVGTVTIMFAAFSHVFSRRASDYFDALPTKRVAVAASRFSAAMVWLWGIILATVVVTTLVYGLLCNQWHFNYIPWLSGYYGVISLFFAAACLCGVSMAGTRFTAFIVSGLVAFLIRFLLLQFASTMTFYAPSLNYHGFPFFLNPYSNIATATIMAPFGVNELGNSYDLMRMMTTAGPMLYTFAVGLVYVAAGLWLYHIRKSETSGRSAPNAILQTVYRCGITLPILLAFVLEYFMANTYRQNVGMSSLVISALVSSLMVYLIFEIITQRRLKGLLKTLPYYVVLMAFCVLFAFAAKSVAYSQQRVSLQAEEVSGITLISNQYETTYSDIMIKDLTVQDEKINTLLTGALKRNVYDFENLNRELYYSQRITVRFYRKNGGSIVRNIVLTDAERQLLKQLLIADKEFMQQIRRLPDQDEIGSSYLLDSYASLSDEQARALYGLMVSDMKALSDKDAASILLDLQEEFNGGNVVREHYLIATMQANGYRGYRNYRCNIDLTSLTPNALAYYIGIAQEQLADSFAKSIPSSAKIDQDVQFTLTMIDLKTGESLQAVEGVTKEAQGQYGLNDKQMSAFTLIRQAVGKPQSDALLEIGVAAQLDKNQEYNEKYGSGTYYLYLTSEQVQTLKTLLEFK